MPEEKQTPQDTHIEPVIRWMAPEYKRHEKGRLWFMIAGVIVLMLVVYFILTDSASAAIAFLLLGALYFLVHRSELQKIKIEINEVGIKIGKRETIHYSQIQNFWIMFDPPHNTTLNILLIGKMSRHIQIELGEQDPSIVRRYLRQQIPEVEGKEESIWDILMRILKI